MNKHELIKFLGTIAHSGTQNFLNNLSNSKENNMPLIGKFGVGFYSSFMVASKVIVVSKKAGESQAFTWISTGKSEYSINKTIEKDLFQGTKIFLTIKESEEEYLNNSRIKNIIKMYSEHLSFPIKFFNENGESEIINQISAIWIRNPKEIKKEEYENFYSHISYYSDKPWLTIHNKIESLKFNYINLLFVPKNKPFDLFHPDKKLE
jgi:molecular chaperone HtpG